MCFDTVHVDDVPQWRRPPEGARTSRGSARAHRQAHRRNGGAPRRGRGRRGTPRPVAGELLAAMEAPPGGGADPSARRSGWPGSPLRRNGGAPRRGRGRDAVPRRRRYRPCAAMEAPPGGGADSAANRPMSSEMPPQWRRPPEGARTATSRSGGRSTRTRRNGGAPRRGRGHHLRARGVRPGPAAAMEAPPGGGADQDLAKLDNDNRLGPQWRRPPEGARTAHEAEGRLRWRSRNGGAPRRGRGRAATAPS